MGEDNEKLPLFSNDNTWAKSILFKSLFFNGKMG